MQWSCRQLYLLTVNIALRALFLHCIILFTNFIDSALILVVRFVFKCKYVVEKFFFQYCMSIGYHGLNYTSSLLKNSITPNAYPRMPNAEACANSKQLKNETQ